MRPMASAEKNRAHCKSRVAKLATTSASTASTVQHAPQRQPNKRAGIGGGVAAGAVDLVIRAPFAVAR